MQPQFISPVANPKQSRSKLPLIVVVVALMAVIIGVVFVLIASNSNNPVSSMDKLNTRMTSLSSYVAEGRTSARSADLIKINSEASILITGDTAALKQATTSAGAQGKTKDVIATEKQRAATIVKDLKSASVDGRFDREFVSTLTDELTDTQTLLREVNEGSSRATVKTATKNATEHITIILASLESLSL